MTVEVRILGEHDAGVLRRVAADVFDNPIQQGVPDGVVAEALQRLEAASLAVDACLITTLARRLNTTTPGKKVHALGTQFGADEDEDEDREDGADGEQ